MTWQRGRFSFRPLEISKATKPQGQRAPLVKGTMLKPREPGIFACYVCLAEDGRHISPCPLVGNEPDYSRCTGISATWCPVCGDCECPVTDDGERLSMSDPRCPLHHAKSRHAEEGVERSRARGLGPLPRCYHCDQLNGHASTCPRGEQ